MEKSRKERERRDGLWKDKESGIWRYRFMFRGKRYFGACPEAKTKSEARADRDRRRLAVREGRDEMVRAKTSFRSFVSESFLPWVEMNRSASTYQSYKWRCDDLIEAFGKLELARLSQIAIEKFKREQMKRRTKRGDIQSPASVNRYLQILCSIFTRAEELGHTERGKRPRIEMLREDNHRLRYLSTDEEERLLAAAEAWPWLEEIIIVGLATGLRRNELFSLTKADVDLTLGLLTVTDGKGGKLRTVPLDPESEAGRVLARLKRDSRSGWIFTSPHGGGKMTRVDKSIAAACEQAKIEPATLHTLRHTFCTRLAAAGVDIRTIKELAGHGDLGTTMRYMHLVESNRHAAIRRLTNYHEITTVDGKSIKARAG